MSSHGGAVSESVPEGPGAARCEVCGSKLRMKPFLEGTQYENDPNHMVCPETPLDHYRLGYGRLFRENEVLRVTANLVPGMAAGSERLRARLVEVERERDEARLEARDALAAYALALSGLPPLTGETAGPVAQALDAREREVMEAWRTYFGELSEVLFPGASLVGWKHIIARARKLTSLAQPTPAALVPKEEDK